MTADRKYEAPQLGRHSGIDWGGVAVWVFMPIAIVLGTFLGVVLLAIF
jgi:hypothetical protein